MKLIYSQIRNIACMVLVMGAMTAMYGQCPPGESQACVTYTSGSFNGENSWLLWDATAGVELLCQETPSVPGTTSVCVVEGNNIQLYAYETFGDNWNGATIEVAYCDDGSANNCPQTEVLYGPEGDPGMADGNGSVTCGGGIGTGALAWNGGFINCIDCDPICVADFTVNNDPGVCGAQLTIANPDPLNAACNQGGLPVGEMTVDGPTDNFIPQGGITHNMDYLYTIPGVVLNTAPCVTEVCLQVSTNTDNGAAFESIQLQGEDGTIFGGTPTGGGDCNDTGGEVCMPVALYNMYAADGNLEILMLANTGVNFCTVNTVEMSVTTFTGCDQYVNDFNGGADASGFYPVGTTIVTFTTTINGVPTSCATSVTVVDNEAPTFNCPADQTISLDAGECEDIFHFDLSVMDNCPSTPFSVDGPFCNPCDDPTAGSALACAPFAQNSIIQEITTGGVAGSITQVCYNQETFGNAPLATFNIYTNDGSGMVPWDDGAGTFAGLLLGTQEYQTVPANSGTCVCVDFDIPVMIDASTTTVWLEVFTPGNTLNSRIVNTPATCNGNTATGMDTYIAAPACGLTPPTSFAAAGFVLDAGYSLTVQPGELEAVPYPTNQYESGDALPIGEHCFGYTATDAAGNEAICEFCITVDEFPEELQTTSLACNDLINISVDQDCEVVLTADDILEGGPYGCYETYMVNAEIVPANAVSGNMTPAVTINANSIPAFAANGMAGTYKVSVIDPGNANNSCWGYIMLEDKLAPTVTCEDVTISCISSSEPGLPVTGSTEVSNLEPGIQWADGTTGDVGSVSADLSAPAGAKITDLRVTLQMDHSWVGDLDIVLTSPDGTEVFLMDSQCGNSDNINATFSASASNPVACGACAVTGVHEDCNDPALYETCAAVTMEVQAVGDLSQFVGGNANGTWTVSIADNVGGDGGCLHSLTLGADYIINAAIPAVAMDNCTPVIPTYNDVVTDLDCQTGLDRIITRRWIASDTKGNTSNVCIQTITVESISLGDVPLPFEVVDLPCGTGDVTPWDIAAYYDNPLTKDVNGTPIIENNEGIVYGFPHYFAGVHAQPIPDSGLCGIYAEYKDHVIDACGAHCHGNKKILRTWKLLDWCTQTFDEYVQIIRAKDLEAPTFIVKDTTVSTRPWDCTGEFMVPEPWELHDNCDIAPTYTVVGPPGVIITPKPGGGYIASGAPKGVHEFIYTATDCCNNSSTQRANIAVLDYVAPNLTTKGDIIVSLTPGGLVDTAALAKLFCPHVDNGSYDACTPVHCEIRRPMGSPDCSNLGINGHNNNMTFNNTDVRFQSGAHPDDNRNDTDGGEFVKFCCDDIERIEGDANGDGLIDSLDAGYVKVIIRVWDDANMSGVYGDEVPPFAGLAPQKDNYNEGWAWVKVECKTIPVITCPPPVTVKCYWDVNFDPSAGWRSLGSVDLSKSGIASAYGCCGSVDVEFSDAGNLTECEEGTFVRTFRAGYINIDGKQSYVQCQQQITVLRDEYPVTITPKNRLFNNPSCGFNDALIDQMRPTVVGGPCDVIGENISVDTFLFENGVCKKWRVTFEYWNWCLNEDLGTYVEYAIYEDTDDPVIMNCADTCIGVDVNCQAFLVLENAAFDTSACTDNEWIKWICEVDLWADGTIDYVAATHFTQNNWTSFGQDEDPWYTHPHSKIHIDATESKSAPDAMATGNQVVTVSIPEAIIGKMSNHKVTWKAIDGCHNESGCQMNVMVADKKAPTPYCVNISSAVMADGSVELWARDFDKNSFDNCTDQEDLYFTFNEMRGPLKDTIIRVSNRDYTVNADIPYFFDEDGFVGFDGDGIITDVNGNIIPAASTSNINKYNKGDIQRWVPSFHSSSKIFDCDEYEAQGPNGALVKMSVWDKKCNTDFCVVYLSLVDNQGGCTGTGSGSRIAGSILTENGEAIANVVVTVEGDVNDLTKVQTTGTDGAFSFLLPENVNYEVTAVKDVDYMNGVSTLDLVLIQRHILGLAELDSEYKFISADVNGDMNIRANDLVDLRKLILGVTNDFPATSWKVVDASEAIAMSTPLQYSEVVYADNLQDDVLDADFVGTKVGDVSGDALSNARSTATENRSSKVVSLVAADQSVKAGQTVEVAITGSNFNEVYGYQFSSNLNGLTLSGVRSGAIEMTDANLGLPSTDVMTASFAADKMVSVKAGEVLFTLEFVATTSGNLSEMMNMNSTVTKAESYTGTGMDVSGLELTFRTEEPTATAVYALNQNEPNPFKDVTTVTYEMAEAGQATFTLYDVTGKVLVVQTEQANKGLNSVEFKASEIRASGIVYYQIESGDFTATKKMIIIE